MHKIELAPQPSDNELDEIVQQNSIVGEKT